jgi:hypothetical protein
MILASFPKTGASSVANMARAARKCLESSSVRLVTRFTNRSATETRGPEVDSPDSLPSFEGQFCRGAGDGR